jgi:transcriptional regulator with XRE-family HTH domain
MASTIQERLRQICDLRNISPEKLSEGAGLSRGYVSRIINSPERMGMMAAEALLIADTGKVSFRWLVFGTGSPDVVGTEALEARVRDLEEILRRGGEQAMKLGKLLVDAAAKAERTP